jgi:hypothetical protein
MAVRRRGRVEIQGLLRKSRRARKVLRKVMKQVVPEEARGFVRTIVHDTPPANKRVKGKKAQKAGERTIDRDLGAVFVGKKLKRKRAITHLFGNKAPRTGSQPPWYVRTKEMHPDVEKIYEVRRARGLEKGRKMTRGRRQAWYVSETKLNRLRKKLKRRVGLLAGGWNAAAVKVGAKLPAWVKRHGTQGGAVRVKLRTYSYVVTMRNRVRYGRRLGLQKRADRAQRKQAGKLQRRLPYVLRAEMRKAGLA